MISCGKDVRCELSFAMTQCTVSVSAAWPVSNTVLSVQHGLTLPATKERARLNGTRTRGREWQGFT